ncbi:Uncharacterised protein [Legionella feeleii]|uniref:Uncharacterized protein n=1 Tax=Legionella feeleii TaxID=453 RepID=A0A2X1QUK8_9GAMM|nr:Uncharacterised protein [Legionella feeleii]STX39095.1 Uncharacterised protein [Legionella feeleii]
MKQQQFLLQFDPAWRGAAKWEEYCKKELSDMSFHP